MIGEAARRTGDVAAWWGMDPADRMIALREARERLRPGLRMTSEPPITPPQARGSGAPVAAGGPRTAGAPSARPAAPVIVRDGRSARQATPQEEAIARAAGRQRAQRAMLKQGSTPEGIAWLFGEG